MYRRLEYRSGPLLAERLGGATRMGHSASAGLCHLPVWLKEHLGGATRMGYSALVRSFPRPLELAGASVSLVFQECSGPC